MKKPNTIKILIIALIMVLLTPVSSITVQASSYSSWVQDTEAYKDFYDNASIVERENQEKAEPGEESFLVQQLGNMLYWIASTVHGALENDTMNLTIDGVVFGKLAQPSGISYTSFDLSDGNIYGIIGATIYTVFRGFTYSGLFIMFLFLLARALFDGSPKSIENLKQGIYSIIISFSLIYAIPLITDLVLFLRDQFMYQIASKMIGNGTSILDSMLTMYNKEPSLIRAIVYLATVGAVFVYIKDYVSVAIQQTILFGFFCVFNLLGTAKKKFLSDWTAMFFSNMLIPVVDIVCLLLPFMAIDNLTPAGSNISFGGACIVMFMIWSARTSRSQIMRLFGNMAGTPAGRGMGGLAMLGMNALGGMMRGMHGGYAGRGRTNEETFNDWSEEAERQKGIADEMNRQGGELTKDLPSLESMEDDERNHLTNNDLSDEELGVASGLDDELELESLPAEDATDMNGLVADMNADDVVAGGMDAAQMSIEDTSEAAPLLNEEMPNTNPNMEEMVQAGNSTMATPQEEVSELPPMSDFEKSRYDNLREMDAINDSIAQDRAELRSGNFNSPEVEEKRSAVGRLEREYANIDQNISDARDAVNANGLTDIQRAEAQQHLNNLCDRRSKLPDELYQARNDLSVAERNDRAQIENRIAQKEAILRERSSAERQFSQISRDHGRDGSQYSSAKEMRTAMETRNFHNQQALEAAKNRANVSLRDMRGLSPETAAQIAEIQKENVRKANLRRAAGKAVLNTAAFTAGAAGAVVAASAGAAFVAYEGQEASSRMAATGAIAGFAAGRGAIKGTANAVRTVSENREEIAANAQAAVHTAKTVAGAGVNAVQKVRRRGSSTPNSTPPAHTSVRQVRTPDRPYMEKNTNIALDEIRRNQAQQQQASSSSQNSNTSSENGSYTRKNANVALNEIRKNQNPDNPNN